MSRMGTIDRPYRFSRAIHVVCARGPMDVDIDKTRANKVIGHVVYVHGLANFPIGRNVRNAVTVTFDHRVFQNPVRQDDISFDRQSAHHIILVEIL